MIPREHLLGVALALALAACGPSVEDVCESFNDECADVELENACVDDGLLLEARAEEQGCEDRFDDYLSCVDDAGCEFRTACAGRREALVDCVGEFPDDS